MTGRRETHAIVLQWAAWLIAALPLFSSAGWSGEHSAATPEHVRAMASTIDRHLAKRWHAEQVSPAPPASDAEFLRRAWLDLCGTIPPINHPDGISGVRDFLESKAPNKRSRLISRLLTNPLHAAHLATIWKNVMLPEAPNIRRLDNGFRNWLYQQFKGNVRYDQMVRDLLLAQGNANGFGPALFYTSQQLKAEDLAASTSRIFLGTQIQCAQCHDHPFDNWKREDFWGYAAFFARLRRTSRQRVFTTVSDTNQGEVKIPDTDKVILPRFLSGTASPDSLEGKEGNRRKRLANWLTSPKNAYFAKATVNRAWAMMFGRGLVDPLDDLGPHNPASHPQLLAQLTQYFVSNEFNLNELFQTIALTRAYQLTSRTNTATGQPELFARMPIKSLTADQLYDCLQEAMRRRENRPTNSSFLRADPQRIAFLAKFRSPAKKVTDFESGIPQALTLMNGNLVRQATDIRQSDLLIALDAPFFSDQRRIEVLFMSTLSRKPTVDEREKMVSYVTKAQNREGKKHALSNILWALLNSAEFALNH